MTSSDLGGSIPLTIPQLRVYLGAMMRLGAKYGARGDKAYEKNKKGDTSYISDYGKVWGLEKATTELLAALNLPEDWAQQMDRLEEQEARRGPK